MEADWQSSLITIKHRGQYVLKSGNYSDCRFLVGILPNQRLITGHRLILAMASPVFGLMFYGSLPEKEDPIEIPDVQPDVFETMLCYIYTDEISFSSFDNACEIYYVAKKYILPHVVEQCTKFLLANLTPKNTCRAYELAKLYEDQQLKETSMKLVATEILNVIADPSFMDIEVSTLMDILDQNSLNIDSELDLFNCLLKFAKERAVLNDGDKVNITVANSENTTDVLEKMKLEQRLAEASTSAGTCGNVSNVTGCADEAVADDSSLMSAERTIMDEAMLRQAVKKIRFLAMTPHQFSEGPARSKLLTQCEAFTILAKLVSPTPNDCPMPEGFCQLSNRTNVPMKRYCIEGRLIHYVSTPCDYFKFKVSVRISIVGVKMKFQYFPYGIIVCIQNKQGSEIARTFSCQLIDDLLCEFNFNSPVFIHHNQIYNIKVKSDSVDYRSYSWDREQVCHGVKFSIIENSPNQANLSSPLSGIIFTT